jgi:acetylornithine/N-succinyldiaminopimelate aminotransferase
VTGPGSEPIETLRALEGRYAMPTYARAPVEFVRGRGCTLWDSEGREYLDLFAGVSVHNAGHCHPLIVEAITEQAAEVAGISNLYYSTSALRLHERLVESSLGGRAFICNSGAEANECAIKLVRRHAHERGIDRPEIVALEGGFHGRTLGALSATVKLAREDLFGPFPEGFAGVPRDDPAALERAVGERTAAVILEPVQGESGVHPIADAMLEAARAACDRSGALLVFDEIQTGMGRTGHLWAYHGGPVTPDVMTAAKALGGGLPVGACVISPEVGDGLGLGEHGSTFAGGPITARAALAALALLSDPDLLAAVRERGAELELHCSRIEGVEAVRRRGLMLGLALAGDLDAREVAAAGLEAGIVVNAPNPETVRLLPPLVISEAEVLQAVDRLEAAVAAVARAGA